MSFTMLILALSVIVAAGALLFHLRALWQKLLGRRLTREFYEPIVIAHGLEFPLVRKATEDFGASRDRSRHIVRLKRDFMAVTYLFKNASSVDRRVTYEERLLMFYFKVLFVCLIARHWLGWRENSTVLKLSTILHYFADVVGERVGTVRLGKVTVSDYLLDS